ncbi:MAG: AEC family transporter [Clostridia bacterium]|nr:AEC family transporter [Clostridia bacterium]
MSLFTSTLSQIAVLFGFILIGYFLSKRKLLPDDSSAVLSKLENMLFIPALVLGTFIENFTVERISAARTLLLVSVIIAFIAIPVAILVSKLTTKDKYIQKIFTYGLSFSNFGFMGNAVVSTLFPDIFFEYLIFTLPLWILIYIWGVPRLLLADSNKKQTFKESLKSFVNPMFIAMIIGMIIGLSGIKLPAFIQSIVTVSGSCMSPVAMLLTGITVAAYPLKSTFANTRVYIISIVRLVILPLIFIGIASFLNLPETIYICALCSLAMPLGLNTIVIPSALGKDTSVAASMAVISHLLSCITIPLIFMAI